MVNFCENFRDNFGDISETISGTISGDNFVDNFWDNFVYKFENSKLIFATFISNFTGCVALRLDLSWDGKNTLPKL